MKQLRKLFLFDRLHWSWQRDPNPKGFDFVYSAKRFNSGYAILVHSDGDQGEVCMVWVNGEWVRDPSLSHLEVGCAPVASINELRHADVKSPPKFIRTGKKRTIPTGPTCATFSDNVVVTDLDGSVSILTANPRSLT